MSEQLKDTTMVPAAKIKPPAKVTVTWAGAHRFDGGSPP